MNQEIIKDLGDMTYADLSQEQLGLLKKMEDEINSNRDNKVFIMALMK